MRGGLKSFLASLRAAAENGFDLVHLEHLPAQAPCWAEPDRPLHPALARALASSGVKRLYSHQAAALDLARSGRDLIAATPTASGKSLIYLLPVLEGLLEDPGAKALFLFPLKALEQDQLQAVNRLAFAAGLGQVAAVYDGDTPPAARKRLRDTPPPILISNPDMLHAGICAYPAAWEEFFAGLRYLVIDEVHTYRGVFGSHLAQILRRLLRLCHRQGAEPHFILCSATIANPRRHAQALTGRPFSDQQVIDQSGAPAAGRHFALLNPHGAASTSAAKLFARAVQAGLATICFTKSRLHTELIHSWVIRRHPELQPRVAGYRAGFLPEERRRIERRLASGRLAGVISTSALEMGIDIGELDVCILVGYPGSHMATWQRSGRVGRAGRDSAILLITGTDALDQYFADHPREFFARPLEAAVLDPDNPHITRQHLVCAAAEEPLGGDCETFDLERHRPLLDELLDKGELLLDARGELIFAARKRPQRLVDIRGAGESYTIVGPGGRVIGSLDGVRAFKEGYPGAVYLHQTRSYVVRHLDLVAKRVEALPAQAAYYTRARSEKETTILEETGRRPLGNFLLRQGRLEVTERITGYERRHLRGGSLLGAEPLDLPPLVFQTHGLWLDIEPALRKLVEKAGHHFMGSIHALEHILIAMFPLFALCDRNDLGGISIPLHPQTGKAAVFVYDGVPGGVGLAERGFEVMEELLEKVVRRLADCDCELGCPACVHSPKCGAGNKPLDKAGALLLARALLGRVELPSLPEPAPLIEAVSVPRPKPARQEMDYCVFDLETQRLAQEVGGWGNAHLMRLSLGVLYLGSEDRFLTFSEERVNELIGRLEQSELVIGFNQIRFDYAVLSAYTGRDLRRLPSLDMLREVQQQLGFRLSLQALARATLGAPKSADGLQAVRWWRQGRLEELERYCRRDVELTRDLFRFGQEKGYLLYQRKEGPTLRVPVDWSWPTLRRRFGPKA